MTNYFQFLCQFLRNPRQVGSVVPSSPQLAAAVLSCAQLDRAKTVVELGPGTGAFTPHIKTSLRRKGAHFFALDINAAMCERLRERFPDVAVYCDSAANVSRYLDLHGA